MPTILWIDHNTEFADRIMALFQYYDYTIVPARSAMQALDQLHGGMGGFDGAVLEVRLVEGDDGLALLNALAATQPRVPIIEFAGAPPHLMQLVSSRLPPTQRRLKMVRHFPQNNQEREMLFGSLAQAFSLPMPTQQAMAASSMAPQQSIPQATSAEPVLLAPDVPQQPMPPPVAPQASMPPPHPGWRPSFAPPQEDPGQTTSRPALTGWKQRAYELRWAIILLYTLIVSAGTWVLVKAIVVNPLTVRTRYLERRLQDSAQPAKQNRAVRKQAPTVRKRVKRVRRRKPAGTSSGDSARPQRD